MNIKGKLKERLLDIPINYRAYRECHRLADDINEDLNKVKFYLNELVELDILIKKTQYICHNCNDIVTMSDYLLDEIVEDGYFQCDNCYDSINPEKDTTGYIYYDIKDKSSLKNW